MKEMIYQEDRKQEILYVGKYKGYKYLILSMGTHPTAYVEIPEGHKLNGVNYDDIDIDVHGGLTYGCNELLGIESNCYYIGWDYAHAGDYMGYNLKYPKELYAKEKKWTTEEIKNDCESVIRQIVDMDEEEKKIPEKIDVLVEVMSSDKIGALTNEIGEIQRRFNQLIDYLKSKGE